jgi:hypothetical protein
VTRAFGRAYGVPVPVLGGGLEPPDDLRSRVARGRPNWWVILAVSLGLMALLVATAGSKAATPRREGASSQAAARTATRVGAAPGHDAGPGAAPSTSTTTTTTATAATTTTTVTWPPASATDVASSPRTTGAVGTAGTPPAAAPSVTPTTEAPATTTTTSEPAAAVAADRTQTQGYLNPPLQPSNQFGFTGSGAMEISVVWSGSTYLTMDVGCPSGGQSVGGTSAMAASLPDASGNCLATVSEPTSESTSLTYTITIGPAGA